MARGDSIGTTTPDGEYTVNQLARKVGVSRDTIIRWCDEGHLQPERRMHGTLEVRIFNNEQLGLAQKLAGNTGLLADRLAS